MVNLLHSLQHFNSQQNYALAIVTNTEGSTYRKAGALMLINESLEYWGLISGGCLESDIQENAVKVFTSQADLTLEYDMRDEEDLLWGMGSGCNGAVNVLIKFLPARSNHFGLFEVLRSVDLGGDYQMQISPHPPHEISFQTLAKSNHKIQKIPREANFAKVSQSNDNQQLTIPLLAPLHLLICGASPDVPPVTAIARQLGWKTTVVDHRAELTTSEKFPFADKVSLIRRSEWNDYPLDNFDAAVIMSHQYERDLSYLQRLLNSNIGYLGLLGPSKRRDRLLSECETSFPAHEGRLFGPVGLDIGADTPETIALAIVAEIQAVSARKQVGFCYQDGTR